MTLLPGRVTSSSARPGFDTWSAVSLDTAEKFRRAGFYFCVRYVKRSRGVSTITNGGSMTREEAEWILSAGLALMPVQFAQRDLMPTSSEGARVGANAAANCVELGFPPGCSVWCDIEAIHRDATTADVLAYANAWHREVQAAGYIPGIYIGPNSKLPTEVLYPDLRFTGYWKSASRVGNVNERGYSMIQSRSDTILGLHVDVNIAAVDSKGGRPMWLEPV